MMFYQYIQRIYGWSGNGGSTHQHMRDNDDKPVDICVFTQSPHKRALVFSTCMACMLNYFDIIFYMFNKMGLSQNGLLQNPVVVQPSFSQ